ncbi:sensor domain-containing diguanylate cyclase [Lacunimicrobium album]
MLKIDSIINSPDLPSLPTVAVDLLKLLRNPDSDIKDIIELVKKDPAMSVRILKAANSSYFGFTAKINSIARAVPLLGTTVVTSLALSFSLADDSLSQGPMAEHYQNYWQQSIIQASACEVLGQMKEPGLENEYFLAGLLMDVGRLAILKTSPREYYPVLLAAEQQKQLLVNVEYEMLGVTHSEITSQMMTKWNMPLEFATGAKIHHIPLDVLKETYDKSNPLIEVAMYISSLVGEYYCSDLRAETFQQLKDVTSHYYGWDESALRRFLTVLEPKFAHAGKLFSIANEQTPSTQDLMLEANRQLVHMTMMAHVNNTQLEAQKLIEEGKRQRLEENQELLKNEAKTDVLTKAYNRRHFDQVYAQELADSRRTARPVGLIFMDIDRFKQLNDNYGHPFGDQVLIKVADVVRKVIRTTDVLARYGGEEFVVIVNQPSEKALEKLAERVRVAIEREVILYDQYRVPVTVSMGACVALPGKNEDLAAKLISQADEAMYDSKKNGRNQVHVRSIIPTDERDMLIKSNQARFSRWLVSQGLIDVQNASQALSQYSHQHQRIGELAAIHGLMTVEQVNNVNDHAERSQKRFGQLAVKLGLLTSDHVASLLALQAENPEALSKIMLRLGFLENQNLARLVDRYYQTVMSPGPAVLV